MAAREVTHLRLPVGVVGRELVQEDDRRAAASLFVVEADVIRGDGVGHLLSFRGPIPENRSKCPRRQCRQHRFLPTKGYCDAHERRVEIDAIVDRLGSAAQQAFERHGAAEPSDLFVDAVGAQQIAQGAVRTDDA